MVLRSVHGLETAPPLRLLRMDKKLKFAHLGAKSVLTAAQLANPQSILDAFNNPFPSRDYQIEFVFPEFTSVCPVTGQPDFATITLRYVPDHLCVEMKSLKLYYFSFRDKGTFYEAATNTILNDLVAVLKPREMTVIGDFNARGGTIGRITVQYPHKHSRSRR